MSRTMLSAALCALLLSSAGSTIAQDQGGANDEMMKKWKEVSTPGENHKKLDAFIGKWDVESKMWPGGPATAPVVDKGSTTYAWDLGGRFVKQEYDGMMMGMSMHGTGYTGYDNYAKKYIGVWMDNSSTSFFPMDGAFNKEGNVLTMYGKMDEWMTGEIGKNVKYVIRFLSKDKIVFEIHDLSLGEANTKMMEMTMTRKK